MKDIMQIFQIHEIHSINIAGVYKYVDLFRFVAFKIYLSLHLSIIKEIYHITMLEFETFNDSIYIRNI